MTNDRAQQAQTAPPHEAAASGTTEANISGTQEHAQTQVEKLQSLLQVALNSTDDGMVIFGADHRLIAHNKRFSEMYGIPNDVLKPGLPVSNVERLLPGKDVPDGEARAATDPSSCHMLLLANGQRMRVTRHPLPDGGWVETHDYAADRRHNEQQIRWLAQNDPLTEVANPLYFGQELENALQQSKKGVAFALNWIDVDNFRDINEKYGQPVGFAVLKAVAERIVHTVRRGDLVARLGGDEFAVIQPGVKSQSLAETLAHRIMTAVNHPVDVLGHSVPVSVSIGVVVAPEHGTSSLELMKNIYLALYAAKAAGRHRVSVYDPHSTGSKAD